MLLSFYIKKPELVATDAQITHATRKLNNALKSKDELAKNEAQIETKVAALEKELVSVRKAAEKAQGMLSLTTHVQLIDMF